MTEYERALELDPHSPYTTYWFGVYLGVVGYFDRSHAMLHRAQELDPLSLLIPSIQGWVHYFARQFNEAVPFYRAVLNFNPNFHIALWFLAKRWLNLPTTTRASLRWKKPTSWRAALPVCSASSATRTVGPGKKKRPANAWRNSPSAQNATICRRIFQL